MTGSPWIELGLALALLAVVPRAVSLRRPAAASRLPVAGALAALSLLLPTGRAAGALTLPWLGCAVALAGTEVWTLLRRGRPSLPESCSAAGCCYLAFGAGWLLLSRLGVAPMGYVEPIVLLTALHFHYAGCAAALMAGETLRRLRPGEAPFGRASALAVLAGPPLLAAGWALWPPLKLAGAALLAAGVWGEALLLASLARRERDEIGCRLLWAAAAAPVAGMALALAYAVGEHTGRPWIDIPDMARWHGALNGLGFALCGVLGLSRTPREGRL